MHMAPNNISQAQSLKPHDHQEIGELMHVIRSEPGPKSVNWSSSDLVPWSDEDPLPSSLW
jgi:hypothetical protein